MSNISITVQHDHVIAESPFHPDLPGRARALGGHWSRVHSYWEFDARDLEKVRSLYREVYGTDGSETETVTARYTISHDDSREKSLFVGGRQVAVRFGRDSSVKLGDGVIVVEGEFPSSGGSMKYPRLDGAGVVIELRDVPKSIAEAQGLEVVSTDKLNVEVLQNEKERLLARLAEIDELLAG